VVNGVIVGLVVEGEVALGINWQEESKKEVKIMKKGAAKRVIFFGIGLFYQNQNTFAPLIYVFFMAFGWEIMDTFHE